MIISNLHTLPTAKIKFIQRVKVEVFKIIVFEEEKEKIYDKFSILLLLFHQESDINSLFTFETRSHLLQL